METSILNEFLILEETNSFSNAAKLLGTSQATISRHIKQLEDEYGVILFERTTQKMKLTPYGEALVTYARAILENEKDFKRDIQRLQFKRSNHLVIGSVDFPFYYGITACFASFKKEYPSATLEVHLAPTDELIQMLRSGEIDVAFIRNINDCAAEFESFPYADDYVRIVVPCDHPLADLKQAQLLQFSGDTFYRRYQKGTLMGQFMDSIFQRAGFTPTFSYSEGSWGDSVINDISSVTLCMGALSENFRGNVHVKVLDLEPQAHADIWLATKKNVPHSDIANNFVDYVKSVCR